MILNLNRSIAAAAVFVVDRSSRSCLLPGLVYRSFSSYTSSARGNSSIARNITSESPNQARLLFQARRFTTTTLIMAPFKRLVRFVPKGSEDKVLLGEPADENIDVGAAVRKGEEVKVNLFSGDSVLEPGSPTGETAVIGKVLSPLAKKEVGTIRCIGLNYKKHAEEAGMSIPEIPTVFLKPDTCLADPWPAPTIIPKHTIASDSADYESELAIIIGKEAKNVSEADALDYVLGYTASNDISSRASQFAQTQWCYSKGFDGACPIGPVLVSKELIPDVGKLKLRGLKNGTVLQDSPLTDLIFSVEKIVSFLSQGTTLPKGTVIITGTPAGVGFAKKPQELLHEGDEFVVEIQPFIGSLVNVMQNEK